VDKVILVAMPELGTPDTLLTALHGEWLDNPVKEFLASFVELI
jgi:hypothetical protein